MDSSESAIWHHWVIPVEEIWTFASAICFLHTLFCFSYSSLSFSAISRGHSSLLHLFPRLLSLFNAWCPTKLTGSRAQLPTFLADSESRPAFWGLLPELYMMFHFLLHVLLTCPRETSSQHPLGASPCRNLYFFARSPSPWMGTHGCSHRK